MREVSTLSTSQEHRKKYAENKEILNTLFDEKEKKHSNWIATICFYTSLHMIEAKMAGKNLHSKSHRERSDYIESSGLFSNKVRMMYKQLETNSKIARYSENDITPTVANQMKRYMEQIENEVIE